MALDPLTAGLELANSVANKIWPDKTEAEKAALAGAIQLAQGQINVNIEEAKSTNVWVSGWRPAIGWTCAASLFTYYVPYCLIATVVWAHQMWITGAMAPRPDLGVADLLGLVATLLGMGGLRSLDKYNKVDSK